MANKKTYKQFPLNTAEEGMQALASLISSVIVNLKKYKEYALEVEELQKKYSNLSKDVTKEILIPAKEYDDINDKLLYRQREILKYLTDYQSSSFSYINLRDFLVKRKLLIRTLDEKTKQLLNELLDVRNWSFHNPQSMLVAAKESAIKRVPKELVDIFNIEPQLNPIIIDCITNYDLLMLATLVSHSQKRIEQFELILDNMKNDYTEMYEKIPNRQYHFVKGQLSNQVFYQELPRIDRLVSVNSDMPQISMAIQKSKYDGTIESFEKSVIKKSNTTDNH